MRSPRELRLRGLRKKEQSELGGFYLRRLALVSSKIVMIYAGCSEARVLTSRPVYFSEFKLSVAKYLATAIATSGVKD